MPRLVSSSYDIGMIAKLRTYATAHIPANARRAVTKSEARIEYKANVRNRRLPEVDGWLKSPASEPSRISAGVIER